MSLNLETLLKSMLENRAANQSNETATRLAAIEAKLDKLQEASTKQLEQYNNRRKPTPTAPKEVSPAAPAAPVASASTEAPVPAPATIEGEPK